MDVVRLHAATWSALQARRVQLPHALLFLGQRGLGKAELARAFAASLLCEQSTPDGAACGQCLACGWFAEGNHPDFRLLQPEVLNDTVDGEEGKKKASQQITIDQVRELDDFLNVGTHRAGLRVILIHPAEAMNRNTANALLKSLEEPAPGTVFLLVSSEPLRLLPTLRSRCQAVPISVPPMDVAADNLRQAGLKTPERWLALAGGAPFLALEWANQPQHSWLDSLLRALSAGGKVDALRAAAELDKEIKDSKGQLALKAIVQIWQKWLVDLNLAHQGLETRYFLAESGTLRTLADMIPTVRLMHAYRDGLAHRRAAEQPLNPRLFLENLFLEYRALFAPCLPAPVSSPST